MNQRSSWDAVLAQSIVGLAIVLIIIAIVVGAWLAVRAANQIARGFAADGRNRLLWALLGLFIVFVAAAAVALSEALLIAAGVALILLVVSARAVELYHMETFQAPPTLDDLRHDMLHEWWPREEAA